MRYYYIQTKEDEALVASVVAYAQTQEVELVPVDIANFDSLAIDKGEHILVSASLEEIKKVLHLASQKALSVGIIPRAEQKEFQSTFG